MLPASLVTPAFRSMFAVAKDFLTVGGWGGLTTSCSGMVVARNMDHGAFVGSHLHRCL